MYKKFITPAVVLWSITAHIFASEPGTLDTTFNPSGPQPGTVSTTIDNATLDNATQSIALQSDGKIVVAGYANISGVYKFALARFNTDGTLDTTFNSAGPQQGTTATTIDNATVDNEGYAVALQPDGKIVVAGYANISGVYKFSLARFNTDGTLDTTFNQSSLLQPGTVSTTIDNAMVDSFAQSIVLQPDGKIVVAGYANISGGYKFALARFNSDGTLDTTFNASGPQQGTTATTIDNETVDNEGYAVALQSDGKIVVAGYANISGVYKFSLARFNTDGTLDTTFNASGPQPGTVSTTIDNETVDNRGYTVALQPDGKIVVAGYANISGVYKFALARFNSEGTLDTTFNSAGPQQGTVATDTNNSQYSFGYSVALESDGKIVVAGYVNNSSTSQFAVARFNSDGALDITFNSAGAQPGTAATDIDNLAGDNKAYATALQSDGKIVVAGWAQATGSSEQKFAVARFNGGSPNTVPNNLFVRRLIAKYGTKL